MLSNHSNYRYKVERHPRGPGRVDVALIRRRRQRHVRAQEGDDAVVLFHRTFRPLLELDELERYAAELGRVVAHANHGTLGCFVDTSAHDGMVEIALYERWFDGRHIRCDELTRRDFDASDEGALVAGAEFVAELDAWAEERNEERDARYLEASATDAAGESTALQRASAADELAGILDTHGKDAAGKED